MTKSIRIVLSVAFVLLYILLSCVSSATLPVYATNIQVYGGYTTALEDLSTDESFNPDDYPIIEDDYSLQVIQIAESSEKELFVYVYQPSADYGNLRASSINISADLHNKLNIKNYKLTLLNKVGVFYKYVVNGLAVSDATTRYYEIISIFRPWNADIDEDASGDNVIAEVPFSVKKQYTFTESDDGIIIGVADLETIEITDKFVGFIRYDDSAIIAPGIGAFVEPGCDSHFVAFSTDKKIDKLYEADVYYTTQSYIYYDTGVSSASEEFGNISENYAYLKYTDDEVSHTSAGLFGRTYTWERIQTIDDFLASDKEQVYTGALFNVSAETKINDDELKNLESKEWVLRFAETEFSDVKGTVGTSMIPSRTIKKTLVGDITILRLYFETDGDPYNLPVIDNKQTGDGEPVGGDITTMEATDMFKIILTLLLIVILVAILGPFLPMIISVIIWIIKTAFKIATWIITLPFRIFGKRE